MLQISHTQKHGIFASSYFLQSFTVSPYAGEQGGLVLIPALTVENKKILDFLVDLTLPTHLFEAIFR